MSGYTCSLTGSQPLIQRCPGHPGWLIGMSLGDCARNAGTNAPFILDCGEAAVTGPAAEMAIFVTDAGGQPGASTNSKEARVERIEGKEQ